MRPCPSEVLHRSVLPLGVFFCLLKHLTIHSSSMYQWRWSMKAVSCHWQPSRALVLQSIYVLHPVEMSPMMIHFQGHRHTKHCLSKQKPGLFSWAWHIWWSSVGSAAVNIRASADLYSLSEKQNPLLPHFPSLIILLWKLPVASSFPPCQRQCYYGSNTVTGRWSPKLHYGCHFDCSSSYEDIMLHDMFAVVVCCSQIFSCYSTNATVVSAEIKHLLPRMGCLRVEINEKRPDNLGWGIWMVQCHLF